MGKTIHLDAKSKRKIQDLLKIHPLLVQHRNSRLERVSAVFYGLAVGCGFWIFLGTLKAGWFDLAPLLLWVLASSWLVAEWLAKVKTTMPIKLNIK